MFTNEKLRKSVSARSAMKSSSVNRPTNQTVIELEK